MTLIPNTRNIAYTWINKQKMYRFTETNSMNTKLSFYQQVMILSCQVNP